MTMVIGVKYFDKWGSGLDKEASTVWMMVLFSKMGGNLSGMSV